MPDPEERPWKIGDIEGVGLTEPKRPLWRITAAPIEPDEDGGISYDIDPLSLCWVITADTVGEALTKGAQHYYTLQMSLPPEPGQGSEMAQIVSPQPPDAICWCCGEAADFRRSCHVQHREDAKSVLIWFTCLACMEATEERTLGGEGGLTGFGLTCHRHTRPSFTTVGQIMRDIAENFDPEVTA